MTAKVEGTIGCKCGFESLTPLFLHWVLVWIKDKAALRFYAGAFIVRWRNWFAKSVRCSYLHTIKTWC